jgi:hypothetical protein
MRQAFAVAEMAQICKISGNRGTPMTRGEKIVWIWVWSALTVAMVALGFIVLQYWSLPVAYYYAFLCDSENKAIATKACERFLSFMPAPAELRPISFRRLAQFAKSDGKDDVAIRHLTSLIQSRIANAEDWNSRGLSHYTLQDYDKVAGRSPNASER